jgi:hypothetical protein
MGMGLDSESFSFPMACVMEEMKCIRVAAVLSRNRDWIISGDTSTLSDRTTDSLARQSFFSPLSMAMVISGRFTIICDCHVLHFTTFIFQDPCFLGKKWGTWDAPIPS